MKDWQDLDQDGVTDTGELRTLEEWSIAEINLSNDNGSSFGNTDDDVTVFNTTIHGSASFVMNGEEFDAGVGDIALSFSPDGVDIEVTSDGFPWIAESTGAAANFLDIEKRDGLADISFSDSSYNRIYVKF